MNDDKKINAILFVSFFLYIQILLINIYLTKTLTSEKDFVYLCFTMTTTIFWLLVKIAMYYKDLYEKMEEIYERYDYINNKYSMTLPIHLRDICYNHMKNEQCSICLEKIERKSQFYMTYCGHFFHKNCIQANQILQNCPICREQIIEIL